MSNPEFREGLNAAIEKRRADFVGAAAAQSPTDSLQGATR